MLFLCGVGMVTGVFSFVILCIEVAPLLRWMDKHHVGWKEEMQQKGETT